MVVMLDWLSVVVVGALELLEAGLTELVTTTCCGVTNDRDTEVLTVVV